MDQTSRIDNCDGAQGILRVDVVVPTINEAETIRSLLSWLEADDFNQIIVVDGGSTDGTVSAVRENTRASLVETSLGRGLQIRAGVEATRADVVLILHADSRPPVGAVNFIRSSLADEHVVGGCFRLRFCEDKPLLRLSAWFSRFDTAFTTFGDQGFFMRRSALEKCGGVPTTPFLEDVELRRRLRKCGGFVKLAAEMQTSSRRFQKNGIVLGQARNALILLAYQLGVSPESMLRFYKPHKKENSMPNSA
jgi:rSAM/selenodomain-associated transferase 2